MQVCQVVMLISLFSDTTPSVLHYQCQTHDKMGNSVQTGSNILDTEHDSTVRGTLTATTFSGNLNWKY